MVIVAVATADEEKGEQIPCPDWGKEVSPGGGGHLTRESEEDTVWYANEGYTCRWQGVISC